MKDIRTATIVAPEVKNEACGQVVASAFKRLPDPTIKIDTIDYTNGVITVTYDSMLVAIRNIEDAVAQAGFDAGPFKANPDAVSKLPIECRGERN